MIKEIYSRDGTVTRKQISAIEEIVKGSDWTEKEIKRATGEILDHLDNWEMKRAGELVLGGLDAKIELERERLKKAEETQRLIESVSTKERLAVEEKLREIESEEIEEHL